MKRLNNFALFFLGMFLLSCTQGGVGSGTSGDLPVVGNSATGESVDFGSAAGTPERPGTQVSLDPGCDWNKLVIYPNDRGPFYFKPSEHLKNCEGDHVYYQAVDCQEIPQLNLEFNPDDSNQCRLSSMEGKIEWADSDCSLLKYCDTQTPLSDENCPGCMLPIPLAETENDKQTVAEIKVCNQYGNGIVLKSSVLFNNGQCRLPSWPETDWMDCDKLYSTCCDQPFENCQHMPTNNAGIIEFDPNEPVTNQNSAPEPDVNLSNPQVDPTFELN